MSNPRVSAIVSLIGIILVGSMMLSSSEAPSAGLAALQWILLIAGVVGLVGSMLRIGSSR
jgi:hypothetical protein